LVDASIERTHVSSVGYAGSKHTMDGTYTTI